MTKAIDYFKRKIEIENQICNLPTCDDEVKVIKQEHIAYMQSAIAALEKQIPQKWEYERVNDDDTYVCPCCKEYWYMDYGTPATNEYNYCPNCGQALVWE